MISLYPLKEFKLPVIAECINPDVFQGKASQEIETIRIWEGNKQRKLGELFKVEETKSEGQPEKAVITIRGNVSKVRRIGYAMKAGEIVIHGDVGMHLGEEMKGGRILVHGSACGWAGSMMRNGTIEIHGNAGDYIGAPYRGSFKGMRGGKIIVYGNVGNEMGTYMRKGVIKVYGSAGQFVGFRMREGTIYVQRDADTRAGASMTGGKIIIGGFLESVLPTFTIDSVKQKAKVEEDETAEGPFYLFLGDMTEDGNGKLYVHKAKNPQLSRYERFL
jgi:formylmethanofuran dehydrogenase subunit C